MNYFITGIAGTGKTSVCNKLKERGYNTYDIDEGLCSWINKESGKHADWNPDVGSEWVEKHQWICDIEELEKILSKDAVTIVCGIASNSLEMLPYFDKVILLTLEDELLKKRLSARTGKYDWAKTEIEQSRLLSWKDDWEQAMVKAGAIPTNTNKPLEMVIEEVLQKLELSDF